MIPRQCFGYLKSVRHLLKCSSRNTHDGQGTVTIKDLDLSNIELDRIRNFSIIAHIDHGKSTVSATYIHNMDMIKRTFQLPYMGRLKDLFLDSLESKTH